MLSIALLGPFRASPGDGTEIEFRTHKERALLAFLAVEAGRPHRREALAELLWPERPEGVARTSLRQALAGLRRAIGGRYLAVTRTTARFNVAAEHWLDVTVYGDHWQAIRAHIHDDADTCPICMGRLQQAVALYRGDFLAGLVVDDSRDFQEWVTVHRERLFRQQGRALRRLAEYRRGLGDLERARRYARQWVDLDPWSERAHRQRMEVLALSGQRRAALEQYETCRRMLGEELVLEPGPETVALHEQIRDGLIRPPPDRPPAPALHNLPAHLTPFVGRERELGLIDQLLSKPDCRLLTIVGPGGVGKTRLALRAAERIFAADTLTEGVWFVPLENIPSPNLLAVTVAEVLGLDLGPRQTPEAQLLDHLRPRTMLLVLDNVEPLLHPVPQSERQRTEATGKGEEGRDEAECADLLLEILREAPGIKILVASRERLNCRAEFLMSLEGLPFPVGDLSGFQDLTGLRGAAVQLFLERAGRAQAGFAATDETAPAIVRICQMVEGLPLGIELAASSLGPGSGHHRPRSCEQVAQAIHEGLDALAAPLRDLPRRQRSIRAAFEHSWRLLSEGEKETYRRLSVFRGGFGPEAARAVVGEAEDVPAGSIAGGKRTAMPLQALVSKSLLRQNAVGRYDLHPLLQQFASEKLAVDAQEALAARARHGRYFLAFLRKGLKAEKEALGTLDAEIGNLRAGWEWAVDQGETGELEAAAWSLAQFFIRTGRSVEAQRTFEHAADHLLALPGETQHRLRVAGRLRAWQADFMHRRGQFSRMAPVTQAAIELAGKSQDALGRARGIFGWGICLWEQGEYERASGQLQKALSLAQTCGANATPDQLLEAQDLEGRCLNILAGVCWRQGDLTGARSYLERMLSHFIRTRNQTSQAAALGNLGVIADDQGDYARAISYYQRALEIEQKVGRRHSAPYNNLGELHLKLGAYAQAESYLQQALEISREIDSLKNEAIALGYLGLLAHYRGDDDRALEISQGASSIAQEIGDLALQAEMWMMIGHGLVGSKRPEEASKAYRESIALRRELGQTNLLMEPLAGLARASLARDDPARAQTLVEEILAHLRSGGTRPAGSGRALEGVLSPFQVYLTCYHVLEANQDPRARELLDTAHDLLQEQAAKITDGTLRRSFLENVPAHRELAQAFGRMQDAQ